MTKLPAKISQPGEGHAELTAIEPTAPGDYTPAQIDLIRNTIAKSATAEELQLFLYRCRNLGLDPLKPGQIHFVKYGSNPGSIVVGIEGFRSRAARTGKHTGTKRGIIRDDRGRPLGAWAEIYRSDWQHPAREEVSLAEYNTGRGNWQKMPETMIKKVAEAAALRIAFPDDLGGVYAQEEMDQAERSHEKPRPEAAETSTEKKAPISIDAGFFEDHGGTHRPGPPWQGPIHENSPGDGDAVQKPSPGSLSDSRSSRAVTEKQLKRLYAIVRSNNWPKDDVVEYMRTNFGKESSTELNWAEYDRLCNHVLEHPRPPEEEGAPADFEPTPAFGEASP